MAILHDFYDIAIANLLSLQPPMEGLEPLAAKAVFWRTIKGVRILRGDTGLPWDQIWPNLAISMWHSLGGKLGADEEDSLRASLRTSLWTSVGVDLRTSLWGIMGNSMALNLRENLEYGLWTSLYFACSFVLLEDKSKAFANLLQLWKNGNFPLGFDQEDHLIILAGA
jgi:hypothetical protein